MARPKREKKAQAPAAPPDPIRVLGLLVAWVAGAGAGWRVGQADLLEGVIRGALVWTGVTALWMVGCALGERILAAAPAETEDGAEEESAEEQPAAQAQSAG